MTRILLGRVLMSVLPRCVLGRLAMRQARADDHAAAGSIGRSERHLKAREWDAGQVLWGPCSAGAEGVNPSRRRRAPPQKLPLAPDWANRLAAGPRFVCRTHESWSRRLFLLGINPQLSAKLALGRLPNISVRKRKAFQCDKDSFGNASGVGIAHRVFHAGKEQGVGLAAAGRLGFFSMLLNRYAIQFQLTNRQLPDVLEGDRNRVCVPGGAEQSNRTRTAGKGRRTQKRKDNEK